jgi:uncharacterized protein YeaC (DUF1315 family)
VGKWRHGLCAIEVGKWRHGLCAIEVGKWRHGLCAIEVGKWRHGLRAIEVGKWRHGLRAIEVGKRRHGLCAVEVGKRRHRLGSIEAMRRRGQARATTGKRCGLEDRKSEDSRRNQKELRSFFHFLPSKLNWPVGPGIKIGKWAETAVESNGLLGKESSGVSGPCLGRARNAANSHH